MRLSWLFSYTLRWKSHGAVEMTTLIDKREQCFEPIRARCTTVVQQAECVVIVQHFQGHTTQRVVQRVVRTILPMYVLRTGGTYLEGGSKLQTAAGGKTADSEYLGYNGAIVKRIDLDQRRAHEHT